jgi:hypothetical protein
MTADTERSIVPTTPVVNPHRYIFTPSLEFSRRKHSDGTVICEWPILHEFQGFRLYVKPKEIDDEYSAFHFALIGLIRRNEQDDPSYEKPESLVREVCNGFCDDSGITYSYFGDPLLGASGMVQNLDPKALAEALMYVSMYQKKWCFTEA